MKSYDINKPQATSLQKHLVYNGMDCLVTAAVDTKLDALLTNADLHQSYQRSMGELSVAMRMGLRGFAIDTDLKASSLASHLERIGKLKTLLTTFALARWERDLNVNSPRQMKEFWFGKSPVHGKKRLDDYKGPTLGMAPIYTFAKGQRKLSCDRSTLEKLSQKSGEAALFVNLILRIRDLEKETEVFGAKLSPMSRMRCGLNVAGTDTFRWSSNETPLWDGRNLQNVSESLRNMFVADPGYKLAYIDFEQAESRIVAYVTGDANYIAACEGGDLHTTVCTMVWPELDWPVEGSPVKDFKAVAEQGFYRSFSYRDMGKRGGHATNYFGKPPTVARNLNIETRVVAGFQANYFEAFAGIPQWHDTTRRTLLNGKPIVTALGRSRQFFGRSNDDVTLRAAIAYEPQSTLSSIVKQAHMQMCRFEDNDPRADLWGFRVLHDLHDAVVIMYREECEDEVIAQAQQLMHVPVNYKAGQMIIPVEAATGWSWGYPLYGAKGTPEAGKIIGNPDGLIKYKGTDSRLRSNNNSASLPLRSLTRKST